jgi:uncharacterized protein (TIGR02285 family)
MYASRGACLVRAFELKLWGSRWQMKTRPWFRRFLTALVAWMASLGVLLVASAALAQSAAKPGATEPPSVTWYTYTLPPLYISEGSQSGKGVLDLSLRDVLVPALPGYQHAFQNVPVLRLEQALRNDPNACVVGLFRNPAREAFMHFSIPLLQQLPPGVFVARKALARLAPYQDTQGVFTLRAALASGKIRVGAALGRSYGATIDALLAEPAHQAQVVRVSAANPTLNLLSMLSLGRVEMLLALPYEPTALRRLDGANLPDMVYVPVGESAQRINGHVACAKSPQGLATIVKVDALLSQPSVIKAVRGYYESWLGAQEKLLNEKMPNTTK